MARNRKSTYKKQFKFKGYVSCNLDKSMRDRVLAWQPTSDDIMGEIDRLTSDGYKVSFGQDKKNDCIQTSITAYDVSDAVDGYVLTGRGGSLYDAIKSALYKHLQILEADWTSEVDRDFETGDVW